ncbi:unnamed protein product [Ascophyllum nodosum]
MGLLFIQREDGVRSLRYHSFYFGRDVAAEVSSRTFAALPGILESVLNPSHGCQTATEKASRIPRVTSTSTTLSTMQHGSILRVANASMCISSSSISPCPQSGGAKQAGGHALTCYNNGDMTLSH